MDASIAISLFALIVSLVTVYLQWFRVRGPVISLLNQDEEQRAILRPYEGLPEIIQQQFPEYKEKYPGYALVRLIFANSGDRAGFTKIVKVQLESPTIGWSEKDQIKFSYYTHNLVPAFSLVQQDLVLRNIPPIDAEKELNLVVSIEWGGPNPRRGNYIPKGTIQSKLKVVLYPSSF